MAPSRSRKRRRVKPSVSAKKDLTKSDGSHGAEYDSFSQTSIDAGPGFPYLSLPAELRNEITTMALTGGEVYLRSRQEFSEKARNWTKKPDVPATKALGVGFLATCRQAYEEAHVKYYTGNVFFLPPGSPEETESLLAKIKPEHLAMIRRVMVKLSLEDLTPSVLAPIEHTYKTVVLQGVPLSPEARLCALALYKALGDIWQAKIYLARTKFFTGLQQLQILHGWSVRKYGSPIITMRGRDADGLFGDYLRFRFKDWQQGGRFRGVTLAKYDSMVEELIHNAGNGALFAFHTELREGGWKQLKRRLVVKPAMDNYLAGNSRW